jgi:dCTP deaminase
MSILSKSEILDSIADKSDPLVITPLLDERQIGAASIDVRLGHQFIILRRSSIQSIDPTVGSSSEWNSLLHKWQERIRISLFRPFVLSPGQLVLGATLEYVSIPRSMTAAVEGRSSWGRLGLIIATAVTVGPGFKGCVTLELVNEGGVPLVVYPGVRIAQLVFQRTGGTSAYLGKYTCPTGPEFSKIHADADVSVWGSRNAEK